MATEERRVIHDDLISDYNNEEEKGRLFQNTEDEVRYRRRQKKFKKKKLLVQEQSTMTHIQVTRENATQTIFFWTEEQHTTNSQQKKFKKKKPLVQEQSTMTHIQVTRENATQTIFFWNEEQHTTNSQQKKHKGSVEKKASFILLCLKGIIMVAAIVLISSSEEISKAKPCDLEKALKSVSINNNFPCKHHAIKDEATNLRILGIAFLVVNFIYFILILIFPLLHQIGTLLLTTFLMPKILKITLFSILASYAIILSIEIIKCYNDVLNTKAAKTDINFVQLKSTMFNLLEENYTSDNISSNDAISNSWNKFFIEYDCCAINQVTGTTNDFDGTPWCTTSGSCQATASQIPKTCCNGVSEDDYGSAPTTCHSSVNSGTYKSNCMIAVKLLSVTNIEEYKISLLQVSLLIIGTLEIAEAFLVLVLTIKSAIISNQNMPEDIEN